MLVATMAAGIAFPTRVGMNRQMSKGQFDMLCIPHPRGDEPNLGYLDVAASKHSPPAWG